MKKIIISETIVDLDDEISNDCICERIDGKNIWYFYGELDQLVDLCTRYDDRLKNDRVKAFTIYRHPDYAGYWGFEY